MEKQKIKLNPLSNGKSKEEFKKENRRDSDGGGSSTQER